MNKKVDDENGKAVGMMNVQAQKVGGFQAMNFGRILVVSFQLLPLVLGDRGCGRSEKQKI